MRQRAILPAQTVSGLRTRYFPKSRIGHGVVTVAPWVDIVLVLLFLVFLQARFVVQPGIVVQLPRAPFANGLKPGLVAVVLALETPGGAREEMVFFNDTRFRIGNAAEMERLHRALRTQAKKLPDSGLILEADRAVTQGTLVTLFDMARKVGIQQVSLATREGSSGQAKKR